METRTCSKVYFDSVFLWFGFVSCNGTLLFLLRTAKSKLVKMRPLFFFSPEIIGVNHSRISKTGGTWPSPYDLCDGNVVENKVSVRPGEDTRYFSL